MRLAHSHVIHRVLCYGYLLLCNNEGRIENDYYMIWIIVTTVFVEFTVMHEACTCLCTL